MRRAAFAALMSHWRRQPAQLITLVLGLALATGLWSAVQAINSEARASYAEAAGRISADQFDHLQARDGGIPLARYVALRRAGWVVAPVLEGRIAVADGTLPLLGIDPLSYPVPVLAGDDLGGALGDVIQPPGRMLVHPETAPRLTGTELPAPLISERIPKGLAMADIGLAEILLDRPGQLSRLLLVAPPPEGAPPLDEIAPELRLVRADTSGDVAQLTGSFHLNLTAFGLLAFAVGLFIVHGTAGLAFEQRRGLFRTLRALGVPARTLTRLVLAELVGLALLAGGLGLIIGYGVAAALLPDVAASLRGLYGAEIDGTLAVRPIWFASGLAMAVLGALTAGAQGVWRLQRLPVLAATGQQGWSGANATQARALALAGLGLMAGGAVAVGVWDGLLAGFASLAGLLLGAALILPLILHWVLSAMARRATGTVSQWAWADMTAQVPGLSLALMALLLALATNVGVSTMVSSFRLTFTGWLDQRLASELYVAARSEAQAQDLVTWLEPQVDALLPIRSAETRLAGRPARVYGIIDHPTYREKWPLLAQTPDVWDRLAQGHGVLINEQLARSENLWPGDGIEVTPQWRAEIVGVYSDYGNPAGQAIVALPALLRHFDDVPDLRYGIRVDPSRVAPLADALRAEFDLPPDGLIDQASLKALSLGIFDKTFLITGALNTLTLGVAGFAMLTSLLSLWTMRLPQIAPVWALGLSRARLARLEVLRSLCLAALTGVLALPLGLVLAWVLLAVINVEAFGWRLPMQVFPASWVWLFALALLAAGLAAALPARRLMRLPPAELLKVFANER